MAINRVIRYRRAHAKSKKHTPPSRDGVTAQVKKFLHLGEGKITTLHELWIEQLRDLHDAELRLVEALPEMVAAASDAALKEGFRFHLTETKEHVLRLERLFRELGERPDGKTCQAMRGLIEEGSETIHEDASPAIKDAALIAAAQRIEHYEMAGYGTVRSYAQLMGHHVAAGILQGTLDEEGGTNKKLTAIAKKLNIKPPLMKKAKTILVDRD